MLREARSKPPGPAIDVIREEAWCLTVSNTERNIQIRDARDRLIDLLGLGETNPLRDLPVRNERLTVPLDNAARIPVDNSQLDVSYQLFDRDNKPATRTEGGRQFNVEEDGTGDTVLMETPPIQEDVTYRVLARKVVTGPEAYLHESAMIKVGLDTSLDAEILAPLLDPASMRLRDRIHASSTTECPSSPSR